MKKFFYLSIILLSFFACKAQTENVPSMTKESATDIYLSYLNINGNQQLSSYFSKCQLEYKEKNNIGVYTCTIPADEKKDYIFVISESAKLKSEVNPTKKDIQELVYIAYLDLDKEAKKLTGQKLLFSVKENLIIDNQEIKQHF